MEVMRRRCRPNPRGFRRRGSQMPAEKSTRMNCSALLTCCVHPVADLGLRLSDEAVRALRRSSRDARSRDACRRSLDAELDWTAGSAAAVGVAVVAAVGGVAAASVARSDLDAGAAAVSATRSGFGAGGAAAASPARSALAGG